MSDEQAVEIVSGGPEPQGSVIWLHGLGADGHDFEPVVPELRLPAELGLRFVFPHAPVQPVTLNGGMPMSAWFDIVGLDRRSEEDETGVRESAAGIPALVEREKERGIPAEGIALAAFLLTAMALAGAVVSNPMPKKTTVFSGFSRAIFRESRGE